MIRCKDEQTLRRLVMDYQENKRKLRDIERELQDSSMGVTAAYGHMNGKGHEVLNKVERAVIKRERLAFKKEELMREIEVVDLAINLCLESEDENHQILFTVIDSNKGMRSIAFDMGLTHRKVRTRFDNAIAYACDRMKEERRKVVMSDTP